LHGGNQLLDGLDQFGRPFAEVGNHPLQVLQRTIGHNRRQSLGLRDKLRSCTASAKVLRITSTRSSDVLGGNTWGRPNPTLEDTQRKSWHCAPRRNRRSTAILALRDSGFLGPQDETDFPSRKSCS
jgi:hypothetical protein